MTTRRIGAITVTGVEEALRPGFERFHRLDTPYLEPHVGWVRHNGKAFRFEFDHGEPS